MNQYFRGSIIGTLIGLIAGAAVGYYYGDQSLAGALNGVFICSVLSVLEVSISFDNAVVNATVLRKMTPLWVERFLTWGILVAVFGMRLVFPLLIVAIVTLSSPWAALQLAATDPHRYAEIMHSVHHEVAAFGGSFLMLVALKYFVDAEKDTHWLRTVEAPLASVGRLEAVQVGITLGVIVTVASFIHDVDHKLGFIMAGIAGILSHLLVSALEVILHRPSDHDDPDAPTSEAALHRASLGMFLYLEVLDASFSFDGVIGALAITTNLFLIAIGLGIGALFVRSLTVMMVDRGTLGTFRFLEHGAFYAVLALSIIMFVGVIHPVPEIVAGLVGAICIGASIYSSRRARRA